MYATLLFLLLLSMQQVPPSSSPGSTQKDGTQPHQNTQNKITNSAPKVPAGRQEGKDASGDDKKQSDDGYDKWLYHAYEWATIAGVTGGWVVLFIIWRQSQAVINAERAWVMVEVRAPASHNVATQITTREGADGQLVENTHVMVLLVCKNQGRTPGWIFERSLRCVIWDGDTERPQSPDFSNDLHFQVDKDIRPAAVGADVLRSMHYKASGVRRKPHDYILIYGAVKYRDIFGKKRETRFGWTHHGSVDLMSVESEDFHKMN